MTLKNYSISLLLILALGFSTWSILVAKISRPTHIDMQTNLPDAFMENAVTTIMNKQGTPAMVIETPKMTHYPNNDSTNIQQPTVIIYRHSPKPWYINANYAKATQGISQIQFWDHVLIHHLADPENPNTTIQTSTLTVFPDKQTATTDQAVLIKQPNATVHAIGMFADIQKGTVQLLSQAVGEYTP